MGAAKIKRVQIYKGFEGLYIQVLTHFWTFLEVSIILVLRGYRYTKYPDRLNKMFSVCYPSVSGVGVSCTRVSRAPWGFARIRVFRSPAVIDVSVLRGPPAGLVSGCQNVFYRGISIITPNGIPFRALL